MMRENITGEAMPESNNEISASEARGRSEEDGFVGTPVQGFYAGEQIFITGGTGFLGKTLIEKLLRSCPDISRIYLLVRSKKGKTADERMEELFADELYKQVRKTIPDFRKNKIAVVHGDCCEQGLALSEEDRNNLLNNVSIVFHLAATVRFDEPLKYATATNVRCTMDVLELCKCMRKLKSLIHVSTAYSNCHNERIEERFYDYPIRAKQLLDLVDILPEEALKEVMSDTMKKWPNTYSFTKAIAEDLIRENCDKLPIGIFRPGIVTPTAHEPVAGWIDNLYGSTGVIAGAASGVFRVLLCDPEVLANNVPADLTVNALIASAFDVATQKKKNDQSLPIYNFVSTTDAPLKWSELNYLMKKYVAEYPLSNAVWYNDFQLVKSWTIYKIAILLVQVLPALLIDAAKICVLQKPRAWKLSGKIQKFSNALSYFTVHSWVITNENVRGMWLRLNEKDQQLFRFTLEDFDWDTYVRNYIWGIRTYLYKDDPANLAVSRTRAKRQYWIHQSILCIWTFGVAWLIWRTLSAVLL